MSQSERFEVGQKKNGHFFPQTTRFCFAKSVFLLAPKSLLRPILTKSVFLLEKKEHVPLFQSPLVPLLGEVPFIVLRPIFISCYFGGQFWNFFLNFQIVINYLLLLCLVRKM